MGLGGWEAGDYGTYMGDSQVGRIPCKEAGDAGMEAGNAQVGGGPHAYAGEMAGVGVPVWNNKGIRIRDPGTGWQL